MLKPNFFPNLFFGQLGLFVAAAVAVYFASDIANAFPINSRIQAITYSADGKLLLTATGKVIDGRDPDNGAIVWEYPVDGDVISLHAGDFVTKDGKRKATFVYATPSLFSEVDIEDRSVIISARLQNGELRDARLLKSGAIIFETTSSIALSFGNPTPVIIGGDTWFALNDKRDTIFSFGNLFKNAKGFRPATFGMFDFSQNNGEPLHMIDTQPKLTPGDVNVIGVSPDLKFFITDAPPTGSEQYTNGTSCPDVLALWDVETGKVIRTIRNPRGGAIGCRGDIMEILDSKNLIIEHLGTAEQKGSSQFDNVDLASGAILHSFNATPIAVSGTAPGQLAHAPYALSPNRQRLATGGKSLQVIDLATWSPIETTHNFDDQDAAYRKAVVTYFQNVLAEASEFGQLLQRVQENDPTLFGPDNFPKVEAKLGHEVNVLATIQAPQALGPGTDAGAVLSQLVSLIYLAETQLASYNDEVVLNPGKQPDQKNLLALIEQQKALAIALAEGPNGMNGVNDSTPARGQAVGALQQQHIPERNIEHWVNGLMQGPYEDGPRTPAEKDAMRDFIGRLLSSDPTTANKLYKELDNIPTKQN